MCTNYCPEEFEWQLFQCSWVYFLGRSTCVWHSSKPWTRPSPPAWGFQSPWPSPRCPTAPRGRSAWPRPPVRSAACVQLKPFNKFYIMKHFTLQCIFCSAFVFVDLWSKAKKPYCQHCFLCEKNSRGVRRIFVWGWEKGFTDEFEDTFYRPIHFVQNS